MSAPNTNVEKQEKRHAGPLVIMAACVAMVAVILVAFLAFQTDDVEDGENPVVTAPVQTD